MKSIKIPQSVLDEINSKSQSSLLYFFTDECDAFILYARDVKKLRWDDIVAIGKKHYKIHKSKTSYRDRYKLLKELGHETVQ